MGKTGKRENGVRVQKSDIRFTSLVPVPARQRSLNRAPKAPPAVSWASRRLLGRVARRGCTANETLPLLALALHLPSAARREQEYDQEQEQEARRSGLKPLTIGRRRKAGECFHSEPFFCLHSPASQSDRVPPSMSCIAQSLQKQAGKRCGVKGCPRIFYPKPFTSRFRDVQVVPRLFCRCLHLGSDAPTQALTSASDQWVASQPRSTAAAAKQKPTPIAEPPVRR
jgi:hypothetical protein